VNATRLVFAEVVHHIRLLWRVPVAAFFTVAFPMMFLVLFNLLNADVTVESMGGIRFAQFYTPGIAVFAMVTAGYTNLAITVSMDRDEGILKRIRGTPLPPWVYLAGRIGAAVAVGVLSVVLMFVVGFVFFGVEPMWDRLPTATLVLAVGAATFASLGLAVAGVAPNSQAAPAIANATILPLAFVSGIFFPMDTAPGWLQTVAGWFPLRPFGAAFTDQWNPMVVPSFPWSEFAVLFAWLAVGVAVAARTFSWDPRPAGRRRRRG
jgi:ABC-2 type transport system permease protein